MSDDQFLVPVRKADIELGKPLPFAAYDADRNLLLNRGVIVSSEHQVDVLIAKRAVSRAGADRGQRRMRPRRSTAIAPSRRAKR
jgi:hypothetical protein